MTLDEYLSLVRSDGAALAAAAGQNMAAPIPTCPGWTMTRLVTHVGQVHQWVTEILNTRATTLVDRKLLPPAPEGPRVVDWMLDGVGKLCAALEAVGPDAPVWNWSPLPDTGAFWFRRMAEETAVHRWDGENAVGSASALPTALAVEGVDEMLDAVLPRARSVGPFSRSAATIHLHATDADGEWLLTLADGTVLVSRGHAKGDVALRAPASGLLLFLWKRLGAGTPGFEVFGDASVLDDWVEKVQF